MNRRFGQTSYNSDETDDGGGNTGAAQSTKVKPDPATAERIQYLSRVGNALYSITSEVGFETDFFVAKEALNKFQEGIDKLDLDTESRKGMNNLIAYLKKKIEKRSNSSEKGIGLD